MAKAGNLEIEIKIRLGSFTDYLKLVGHLGAIDREEQQINAYFDTPDQKLGEAGYALRVRATDEKGWVTLKSRLSRSENVAVRREVQSDLPAGEARRLIDGHANLMDFDLETVRVVKEEFPDVEPLVLLKFRNTRQTKKFHLADRDLELEIDKTEFADGSVDYELEVELEQEGHFDQVNDGLRRMFDSLAIPYETQPKSKFERALERM